MNSPPCILVPYCVYAVFWGGGGEGGGLFGEGIGPELSLCKLQKPFAIRAEWYLGISCTTNM